jgi:hypothetical protein
MKELISAFGALPLSGKSHSIQFLDETLIIHLDEKMSDLIDQNLLQRGLNQLSRAE